MQIHLERSKNFVYLLIQILHQFIWEFKTKNVMERFFQTSKIVSENLPSLNLIQVVIEV